MFFSATAAERPAIVILDLQWGIGSLVSASTVDRLVEPVNRLVSAGRERAWPVIWVVTAFSPDLGDLPPIEVDRQLERRPVEGDPSVWWPGLDIGDGDLRVVKRQTGAFVGTDLAVQLHRRQRRSVILAGALTSLAVESTARAAADLGFQPVVAVDAVVDVDDVAGQRSIQGSLPMVGRCATVAEIVAAR